MKRNMRYIALCGLVALFFSSCVTDSTPVNTLTQDNQTISTLLPMSANWSYWYGTVSSPYPGDSWFTAGFDDSGWKSAPGPLGYGCASKLDFTYSPITEGDTTPYAVTNEEGKVPATYYRTAVTIDSIQKIKKVSAVMHFDDAAFIYINGVLRAKAGSFTKDYTGSEFDPIKAASITGGNATGAVKIGNPLVDVDVPMKASWFVEGKNTIAVVVFQDTGSSSDCVMGLEITVSDYIALEQPNRIASVIHGDPTSQIGLSWISDGNGGKGYVQYIPISAKTKPETINWKKALTVEAAQEGDTEYSNKVLLTGLKANQRYGYRVCNDEMWSMPGEFKTAEKGYGDGSFSFITVTDPQGSTEEDFSHWAANMRGIDTMYPNSNFLVVAGDFVNDGLSTEEWKLFFNPVQDVLQKTIMVPVTGNHEGYDYPGSFVKHFNTENQAEAITAKGAYYSFNYENTHFSILNTDEKENEDLSATQLAWFEEDLKKAREDAHIKWLIVVLHRSLYSSGDHSTDGDVINFRSSIGQLLDTYEADIVLSGHDHVYMRTKPIYNQIGQHPETTVINSISYQINPIGTTHIVPATISNKNYELSLNADYRVLQAAEVEGKTYDNGRPKLVSYSLLSNSKFYPDGVSPNASVFTKIDINKNTLTVLSYAVVDGKVEETPFDSFGIIQDTGKTKKPVQTKNKEIPMWENSESASFSEQGNKLEFEETVYNAEIDFKKNTGTQGPLWYYFYEKNNTIFELTPMKGKEAFDGTTKTPMDTNCLFSEFPNGKNIGNDSIQNGSVRLYDGAHDGNPRPEGERMTLVPYSDANNAAGKDDIIVGWKAPKKGSIYITDWNPEFIGIVPAEKYLNTSAGFRVDIRYKKKATGNPLSVSDYAKDSVSILDGKTYDDADGVVSGGAPKLIDKAGPFDGNWTTGALVRVKDIIEVEEGDWIYFVSHSGNNYGWRGVMLDCEIRYVKK